MARRPRQLPARPPLTAAQIKNASYVGSPEHKTEGWWGGLPNAYVGPSGKATRPKKLLTSICPLTTAAERKTATKWVQAALTARQFLYREGDKDFPGRIWYREQTGRLWIGYCVNGTLGEYKGWPCDEGK